jgi:hypothetical protein
VGDITPTHRCIGAIVAKNPGSANAADPSCLALQRIRLDGDKLLPTVRCVVLKAYANVGKQPFPGDYIQVLNLFYLCEPNLRQAMKTLDSIRHAGGDTASCQTETGAFPWVWYAWGRDTPRLSAFKTRFAALKTNASFYLDKDQDTVVTDVPCRESFPKHTQGLAHDKIVPHLSSLL